MVQVLVPGWDETSFGEVIAKHRQSADGLVLGRLVLENIPMLGELAVLDANNVGRDPSRGPAMAGEPPVGDHIVALGEAYPFGEAGEALRHLIEDRPFGKVVLAG